MKQVFDLIIQAAPSRSTILITGESGTGKELVARAIHANSARSDRAFVTVNSGNLPPDLLESTLFGHVKGAFTGAVYPKKGLCDLADKGTHLLRRNRQHSARDAGEAAARDAGARVHAARRHGDDQGRRAHHRRHQLRSEARWWRTAASARTSIYRLHVINIYLPPLRERKDDIPLLAQHFLEKYGEENNKPGIELTPDALDLLTEYDWPGNVRELENVIERAVVLASGPRIGTRARSPTTCGPRPRFQIPKFVVPPEGISFKEVITSVEKRLIESTLEAAGGVQKRAAELLGIKPTTLNEMIKRHEIGGAAARRVAAGRRRRRRRHRPVGGRDAARRPN